MRDEQAGTDQHYADHETAVGTDDQPKRWSNALTTIIAPIDRNAKVRR